MYQRYYKQRRFGRFFSFFLVVGSGLSYYVKTGYRLIKETVSIGNIGRYSDYMPENAKLVIDKLNNKTQTLGDLFKEDSLEFKKKFWIYENNLNRLKDADERLKRFGFPCEGVEDARNKETYYLYKKYRDKLI
jgi:hypothetical protein